MEGIDQRNDDGYVHEDIRERAEGAALEAMRANEMKRLKLIRSLYDEMRGNAYGMTLNRSLMVRLGTTKGSSSVSACTSALPFARFLSVASAILGV